MSLRTTFNVFPRSSGELHKSISSLRALLDGGWMLATDLLDTQLRPLLLALFRILRSLFAHSLATDAGALLYSPRELFERERPIRSVPPCIASRWRNLQCEQDLALLSTVGQSVFQLRHFAGERCEGLRRRDQREVARAGRRPFDPWEGQPACLRARACKLRVAKIEKLRVTWPTKPRVA